MRGNVEVAFPPKRLLLPDMQCLQGLAAILFRVLSWIGRGWPLVEREISKHIGALTDTWSSGKYTAEPGIAVPLRIAYR
jgi:hypothetical protein